jgi:hypothetical protein
MPCRGRILTTAEILKALFRCSERRFSTILVSQGAHPGGHCREKRTRLGVLESKTGPLLESERRYELRPNEKAAALCQVAG